MSGGTPLNTLERITDSYKQLSSVATKRHYQQKMRGKDLMPEEFKKENPHTFDGEVKKAEEIEACLLRMKKYFRVHGYFENMKERVAIFNLKGKANIWWEDIKNVKSIEEMNF